MSDKDLLVKKYPFLGYSLNMIEYFGIIGYNEKYVPIMINTFINEQKTTPPTILSSVISNTDFGLVDNDLIIDQVYPDNPEPKLISKNEPIPEPPTSNALYSFCFDSTDGKKKLFHVCFAFKFHEKYKQNDEEYYIPKAFCIISQYYYFSFFLNICKYIKEKMTQNISNSIPIELTIYNIVNFMPSPITYRFKIKLSSSDKFHEVGQLSGYPYLDFDLSQIFNLLPLNLVLEIYILTFLENGMIFFCSNLEMLNMVMFIMYILNYPCNDSTYFWHIVSVSENNFNEDNKFVGKLIISMLGYNGTYDEDIDTSCFGNNHFIVDLDNKKIFVNNIDSLDLEENEQKEHSNLEALLNYIENIITQKEKVPDTSFIKQYILNMKKSLETTLSKNPYNPEFTTNPNPKNTYVDFFEMSKGISIFNKNIQQIFYDFCLNILMLFFQDICFNTSFDKLTKNSLEESLKRLNSLKGLEQNTKLTNEDELFFQSFRGSIKYKIYFENFIQNMDAIDIYKIPLLFSEEFINIKIRDSKSQKYENIPYFSIIDTFYQLDKDHSSNINLQNMDKNYLKNLKDNFIEKKIDENLQLITLNKLLINKYIYFLNNLIDNNTLLRVFPSINIKKENPIKDMKKSNIIKVIQDNFEENDIIDIPNYIIYSLVYVYAISIPFYPFKKMNAHLEKLSKILFHLKIFAREVIYILIKSIYKFYLVHKEKDIYSNLSIYSVKMYFFMLINGIMRENFINPNEEMMKIFHDFFGRIIYQERESIYNKKEEEEEVNHEDDFKIEKNKNFLCFMKHNFTGKKMFSSREMVNMALSQNNNDKITIEGDKELYPTVNVKIKEYSYSSYFLPPKGIYKIAQFAYDDFFDKEFDMSMLNVENIRDVITNLIMYSYHIKINEEQIPKEILVYTLYLLRNYEEKYKPNNN